MTDFKLMPVEPTQDMLSRVMNIVTGFSGPYGEFNDYLDEETAREVYAAFLAAAPAVQGEPLIRLSDYEALQAECDALRTKNSLTLGVGDGTGNLFVHGDYDSIKRVQALIFECGKLRKDVDMLVEALEEFSYGLHQTVDGEDDCRCSQCRFIRMRDAALTKVAGRQPMTKSNPEKPKYLYGQRVIVDNDTIAIFRHYENADLAIEALWVELPDGVVQWRSPHNVKPLPGGQL